MFLFDHSCGHAAFSDDAPNVNRMNVKPGGVQPAMHDTLWNGEYQNLHISLWHTKRNETGTGGERS